jgi:hypothetical protein
VVAGLLLQCAIRPGMTETGPSGKDGKLKMKAGGAAAWARDRVKVVAGDGSCIP